MNIVCVGFLGIVMSCNVPQTKPAVVDNLCPGIAMEAKQFYGFSDDELKALPDNRVKAILSIRRKYEQCKKEGKLK